MKDIEQQKAIGMGLNLGDVLRSRYRILHQLGHGGCSRTYLAEDINRFKERCVLKEFAPQLKGTFALKKAQDLFEREAGILYRLQHSQIPQLVLHSVKLDTPHLNRQKEESFTLTAIYML